jgi:hypothetical protein
VSDGEVSRAWCAFVEGLAGSQSVVGVAELVDFDGEGAAVAASMSRALFGPGSSAVAPDMAPNGTRTALPEAAAEVRGGIEQMLAVVLPGFERTGRPRRELPFARAVLPVTALAEQSMRGT